jgi:hypothetical protein
VFTSVSAFTKVFDTGKLDLTVGKLPPVFDDRFASALRKLIDDIAGFAAGRVNRQREYLWFLNAGHSVGQIAGANEHVTPPCC